MHNNCLEQEEYVNAVQCPAVNSTLAKELPISILTEKKQLYAARGVNPIHDCLPCQKYKFTPVADGGVHTSWTAWIDHKDFTKAA
jgi:hypothetical protein